jgi:peptidoglycan/LPS O-acetylase OafA/YrhL
MTLETYKGVPHIRRIDFLRAVAILLVFSLHFSGLVYGGAGLWRMYANDAGVGAKFLRFTLFDGHRGVVLFFVISGLCIRLSHRAQRSFSIPHFYWRRFWRVYPPYLVALLIFSSVQHAKAADVLAHVFLVHNFPRRGFIAINGPFWSLAIEFQVYLLYPVLLLLHGKYGKKVTFAVLFVLAGVSNLYSPHGLHTPALFVMLAKMPTTLWFTWYTGFLVADRLVDGKPITWQRRCVLAVAVCLVPVAASRPNQLGWLDEQVNAVVMSLLVEEFLRWRPQAGPIPVGIAAQAGKWIGWVGVSSYSFYLYFAQLMQPFMQMVNAMAHLPPQSLNLVFAVDYPVVFLMTAVFSYAAYRLIELPSTAIGRRFHASLRRNVRVPAG